MHDAEGEQSLLNSGISRRAALRLMAYGGSMAILAACGGSTTAPPSTAPPTTSIQRFGD